MTIKNGLIIIFIIIGLYVVLDMRDHNFKRAVDACLAGSQKLSESKITDLKEAKKFCEEQIKKIKEVCKNEDWNLWINFRPGLQSYRGTQTKFP